MSNELRDEYRFDYRQSKPNRFAAMLNEEGMVVPMPPSDGSGQSEPSPYSRAQTELSDDQKHILEDLYAGVPISVDDLPYTDEMEHLHRDFVKQSGLSVTIRDVYKALKNLGRQGRLGGRFRPSQG